MRTCSLSSLRWLAVVFVCLISACAWPPEKYPTDANRTYHAIVEGTQPQLQSFHKRLMILEGATTLEELANKFVACPDDLDSNCSALGTASPPNRLDYYFFAEHYGKPRKFAKIWHDVQRDQPEPPDVVGFKLTFDGVRVLGTPVCPPSPPAPHCYTNNLCTIYDKCTKIQYQCVKCQ
jgi:hypothetical protein